MARFAGSAKLTNFCFTTIMITGRCASQRGSIRKIFETGCKKFAHARMQSLPYARRGIDFFSRPAGEVRERCKSLATEYCVLL